MRETCEFCESCGNQVPDYELTLLSFRGRRNCCCTRCFNEKMAGMCGVAFQHPEFDPVVLCDSEGVEHEFHFRTLLLPTHVSLEAFETDGERRGGYEFQVTSGLDEDLFAAFGRLFQRVRGALAARHLETGKEGLRIAARGVVRGRIAWDEQTGGRSPCFVIDGKEVGWEEFGRMVTAFGGCDFKLEIRERTAGKSEEA